MAGLCLWGHNPAMRIASVTRKLRRFGELSLADKWLLMRAAAWLGIARLRLAITPFEKLAGELPKEQGASAPDPDLLERVGFAVSAAAANVPWRSDCFPQTIAARSLLKTYGLASTVHLGVERVDDDLAGHAWLTCGDTVVTGGADLDRYTEVHRL